MKHPDTCYIFGAGSYFGLCGSVEDGAYVIAADGGLRLCQAEGLRPDILVGDFDSLNAPPEGLNTIRVPVEKDDTDTMLALKLGIGRGCRVFHIYGGTGGRLDHTLANLQSLIYAAERGCRAYLYDRDFVYTAVKDGAIRISGAEDGIFSVFCLSGQAQGVCERGCKYPLKDAVLESGFPLGVSNHFLSGPAEISVARGVLVIGWENQGRPGPSP